MGSTYAPPSWAAVPAHPPTLEILKGGALLSSVLLDGRDHWIIGRAPDAGIVLEHPSASRAHAVLQFGTGDDLYVSDLHSTHGTKLNKKPLTPGVYAAVPRGSVLQFGESARLYVITGATGEADAKDGVDIDETSGKPPARAAAHSRRTPEATQPSATKADVSDDGISWGFADDARSDGDEEVEHGSSHQRRGGASGDVSRVPGGWVEMLLNAHRNGESTSATSISLPSSASPPLRLSEKEEEAAARVVSRRAKLAALESDAARLRAKAGVRSDVPVEAWEILMEGRDDDGGEAGGGLTAGQRTALARAEAVAAALRGSLAEEADALASRLQARGLKLPAGASTAGLQPREDTVAAAYLLPDAEEDELVDASERRGAARGRGHQYTGPAGAVRRPVFVVRGQRSGGARAVPTMSAASNVERGAHITGVKRARHDTAEAVNSIAAVDASEGGVQTYASITAALATVRERIAQLPSEDSLSSDGTGMSDSRAAEDALDAYVVGLAVEQRRADVATAAAMRHALQTEEAQLIALQRIAAPLQLFGAGLAANTSLPAISMTAPVLATNIRIPRDDAEQRRTSASAGPASAADDANGNPPCPAASTSTELIRTVQSGVGRSAASQQAILNFPRRTMSSLLQKIEPHSTVVRDEVTSKPTPSSQIGPLGATSDRSAKLQMTECGLRARDEEVDWTPPQDQVGDGRTSLNDKLGY